MPMFEISFDVYETPGLFSKKSFRCTEVFCATNTSKSFTKTDAKAVIEKIINFMKLYNSGQRGNLWMTKGVGENSSD
jgi:hypothetical protein